MPQGNRIQIAKVLKSNGRDGELVMGFPYFDPTELKTEEPVYIEFDGLPVPFFIRALVRRGSGKALVRLSDVGNRRDAEELVGKAVYADVNADADSGEGDLSFLIGWTLVSGGTTVGIITDFLDIPANPCVEVGGHHIVPVHEDMIVAVDKARRQLEMDLPAGLLD